MRSAADRSDKPPSHCTASRHQFFVRVRGHMRVCAGRVPNRDPPIHRPRPTATRPKAKRGDKTETECLRSRAYTPPLSTCPRASPILSFEPTRTGWPCPFGGDHHHSTTFARVLLSRAPRASISGRYDSGSHSDRRWCATGANRDLRRGCPPQPSIHVATAPPTTFDRRRPRSLPAQCRSTAPPLQPSTAPPPTAETKRTETKARTDDEDDATA